MVNEEGLQLYIIMLEETAAKNENAQGEPPARSTMAAENARDFYGWHRPNVRALVKRMEREYGIKAISMTSYTLPSFFAHMDYDTAKLLEEDARVIELKPVMDDVQFSAWTDKTINGETISWGKTAIGTDDKTKTTFGNLTYILDGGPISHPDISITNAPIYPGYQEWVAHAYHVAGIIGAKWNTSYTRGINPGTQVINVNRGLSPAYIAMALDWVLDNSEEQNKYGVLNISSAGPAFAPGGNLWPYILRVSNRLFVAHAAGNNGDNACLYSFNYPIPGTNTGAPYTNDGIMAIGAIKADGSWMESTDNTHIDPGMWEPGSNYGECVEAWAPGHDIWSTFSNLTNSSPEMQKMSGTSMAAPHVTALAARYGNENTTPVERESYIRSILFNTGATDPSGLAIKVPSYLQTPSFTIPKRLAVSSIKADSSTPDSSPYAVNDKLYLSTYQWNAGHLAPGWIEFDLGSSKKLKSIRMTPEQSPPGQVEHIIYASNSPNPTTQVGKYQGYAETLRPISITLNATARYVRVYTKTSPSNVAWREIEIYGN